MNKKTILIILLAILIAAGWYAYHQYNKPLLSLKDVRADAEVEATALFADYLQDEKRSDSLYLGRILKVTGTVMELSETPDGIITLYLDSGDPQGSVSCEMEKNQKPVTKNLTPGTKVTIKGRCTGFLMDVILNQCILENTP